MSSSSSSSLLHFCAIEKVSSTTWVSVQCRLNNNVSTFKEAQRQALKLAKDKKNKTTTKKSKNIVVTIGGGLDCALQLTKDEMDSYHFDNSNIQLHQVQNNNITNNNITNNNNNKRATAARPQKAVFLRDPLERFLSAFVDKCIRYPYQKHCQPNLLFSSSEDSIRQSEHLASGRNTSQRQQRHSRTYKDRTLTTDLIPSPAQRQQRRRQELNPVNNNNNNNVSVVTKTATTTTTTAADYQYMFDAYIDIFPLSWNVHFYPQALYCNGLFLDLLDEYDFIGMLGSNFYRDLYQFQQKFGGNNMADTTTSNTKKKKKKGRMMQAVEGAFELNQSPYWKNWTTWIHDDNNNDKNHHDDDDDSYTATTPAQTRTTQNNTLLQYYTPKRVRRVLEYMSIDYVLLGLPIPLWAEELLQQEQQQQQH